MRNRAEKRHNDWRKAIRKRKIVEEVYRWPEGWYDNLHQYSKNKIFCSCPMCRRKTSKIKMKDSYGPGGKNWPIADEKRIEEMNDQIFDNEEEI